MQSLSRGGAVDTSHGGHTRICRAARAGPGENQTQSAVDEIEAELVSLTAARARLVAEVGDGELSFPGLLDKFPDFVKNQESLAKRRRVALEDELRSISASLSSVSDELQLLRPLAARVT